MVTRGIRVEFAGSFPLPVKPTTVAILAFGLILLLMAWVMSVQNRLIASPAWARDTLSARTRG